VANPYIGGFLVLPGNGDGTFSATPILTNDRSSLTGLAAFASLAMLILTFRPSGNRMRWLVVLLTLSVAAGLLGCGGGSSNSGGGGSGGTTDPGTPTGTTTVTVTATAGSLSQTVSLSVAVQ
jgi:apolipoprotein N-acyltransferase